jgi:hypothetical protein
MIGNAADRFNTQGELIDGKARELIRKLLEELAALARRNT